jgi:hypothetical protein
MSKLVTIFGGSGFVGRYIARRMAKEGWRVRVAVRRPNEALFVRPYGVVGQVEPVFCNIRDDASVRAVMQGADAVVNCVGVLNEVGRNGFDAVQAEGAARVARIAAELGVGRLVQLSAIGADADSASAYARSKAAGEAVILVGDTAGWLGQSIWLRDICGRVEGAPPPVDLAVERRNGEAVRRLINAGDLTAVHDLSDGGLALALAEMAMSAGIGARIDALPAGLPAHAALFGEDQARYVVTCAPASADRVMKALAAADAPVHLLGRTGGDALLLPGEAPIPVKDLTAAHEGWLPAFMKA